MNLTIKSLSLVGIALGLATVVNLSTASAAGAACVDEVYGYSLTSKTCVKYIQTLSNELYKKESANVGTRASLTVDGKFGTNTKAAITNIQSHAGVTPIGTASTVLLAKDGVVGRQTWAVLCSFGRLFISNPNYYIMRASGCVKSDGTFRAYDYYSGITILKATH